MISRTGIHAIKAMAALAELPDGAYAGAGDLADEIGAPRNYLGKLLKSLSDVGLLESQKGKGGGFRLARPAAGISLAEVVEPFDHVRRWSGCFMGRAKCSDASPCNVHAKWGRVRDSYLHFLAETSVADLVHAPAEAIPG